MVPDRQLYQLEEQLFADVSNHLIADIVHQIVLTVIEQTLQHRDAQNGKGEHDQQTFVTLIKRPSSTGRTSHAYAAESRSDEQRADERGPKPEIGTDPDTR